MRKYCTITNGHTVNQLPNDQHTKELAVRETENFNIGNNFLSHERFYNKNLNCASAIELLCDHSNASF